MIIKVYKIKLGDVCRYHLPDEKLGKNRVFDANMNMWHIKKCHISQTETYLVTVVQQGATQLAYIIF